MARRRRAARAPRTPPAAIQILQIVLDDALTESRDARRVIALLQEAGYDLDVRIVVGFRRPRSAFTPGQLSTRLSRADRAWLARQGIAP